MEKSQCYFMGRYFDSLEELHKYEAEWQERPLDQESAEMLVKPLSLEIAVNALMTCKPMTNYEFKMYLSMVSMYAINLMRRAGND